jgi:hypothetical protein
MCLYFGIIWLGSCFGYFSKNWPIFFQIICGRFHNTFFGVIYAILGVMPYALPQVMPPMAYITPKKVL